MRYFINENNENKEINSLRLITEIAVNQTPSCIGDIIDLKGIRRENKKYRFLKVIDINDNSIIFNKVN